MVRMMSKVMTSQTSACIITSYDICFQEASGRAITYEWPENQGDFEKVRPENEIVGALGTDPLEIASIISGDGTSPTSQVTVTTQLEHGLSAGTPIKVSGVNVSQYNISTFVQSVVDATTFTYTLPTFPQQLTCYTI